MPTPYTDRNILNTLTPIGAHLHDDGHCHFSVWAPHKTSVTLELLANDAVTVELALPLTQEGEYWRKTATNIAEGRLYRYLLDADVRRPDPASRAQPFGVHGPSAVVAPPSRNVHAFIPPSMADMVIYELHIGAFTPAGTFDAAIEKLDHLVDLVVNAVELMPLAQCPGERNWGYDGVYLFAVQHAYGGAAGLERFVQACHRRGLAVLLDVVYNHLGPEGNYLRDFAPYFTKKYVTPWGEAVNFDGPYSDGVRNFMLENARHWLQDYNIDGVRIDAVHAIYDRRPNHILADIALLARELTSPHKARPLLIAESHDNDPRLITPLAHNGLGMDAVWNDDFHHALHAYLTEENQGYYADYGQLEQVAQTLDAGFCYTGQYSNYRKRHHGLSAKHLPATGFVNWLQTHDMIGNRLKGERLPTLLDAASCRLAAALMLLTPGVPMLFMGEEWGETAPFLYFTHHGDSQLIENVRKGRLHEFASFGWKETPPDPNQRETFVRSKLDWAKLSAKPHAPTLAFYRELLRLRHKHPALRPQNRNNTAIDNRNSVLSLSCADPANNAKLLCLFNMTLENRIAEIASSQTKAGWRVLLDSEARQWGGAGISPLQEPLVDQIRLPPRSVILLLDQ